MKTMVQLSLVAVGMVWGGMVSAEQDILSFGVHLNTVVGSSSAEHPADFAPGGHDPNRDGAVQLQSLEPNVSLRYGEYVQGFATATIFTDAKDDFDWEWEEAFLKLHNLPAGMELRGGRFLNRVGIHNPTHLHGWETVDAPLMNALFLGEDGLQTEGGELNFHLPTAVPGVLSFSFGNAPSHDHDHGHGDEDHDEDHDADHDDHEEEHEEDHDDHAHEGYGSLEEFRLKDDVFTVGYRTLLRRNDFHSWTLAAAGGMGDNEAGGDAWFALLGAEYAWRENGLEPGGRAVTWRTEVVRFSGEAGAHGEDDHEEEHDHDAEHDHDDEYDDGHGEKAESWGVSTQVGYQMTERLRPFARLDYVDGVSDLDLDSWTRLSLGGTVTLAQHPAAYVRVQGNFDERGDESEQSVWLQLGLSFGGPEVR